LSCNLVHLAATTAKKKKRTSSIDATRNDAACVIPEAARHSDFYLFFVRSDALMLASPLVLRQWSHKPCQRMLKANQCCQDCIAHVVSLQPLAASVSNADSIVGHCLCCLNSVAYN